MPQPRRSFLALSALTTLTTLAAPAVQAKTYTLKDIGLLSGTYLNYPRAISNNPAGAEIVGYSWVATSSGRYPTYVSGHAFYRSQASGIVDVGVLGGDVYSVMRDINDNGEAVRSSHTRADTSSLFYARPVYWSLARKTAGLGLLALPTLGGGSGRALGINNAGEVVGRGGHAFIWLPAARYGLPAGMSDLNAFVQFAVLGLVANSAWAVGNNHVVVGSAIGVVDNLSHGFILDLSTSSVTDLGVTMNVARAVDGNPLPKVVGSKQVYDTATAPLRDPAVGLAGDEDKGGQESVGTICAVTLQRQMRVFSEVEKTAARSTVKPVSPLPDAVPAARQWRMKAGWPLPPPPPSQHTVSAARQEPCPAFRSLRLIDQWHRLVDLGQWRDKTVVLVPWKVGVASAQTLKAVDLLALRYPKVVFLAINVRNSEEAIHGWLTQRGHFPNLRFIRTLAKLDNHRVPGAVILPPNQRSETSLPAGDTLAATLNRRLASGRR